MSKWTKWIPNNCDPLQEWDSEETIKIKLNSGAVVKGWIESLVGLGPFTHYKRIKANVEAETPTETPEQPADQWTPEQIRESTSENVQPMQPNRLPPIKADAPTEQPEPIITGPGEYVTANGWKAFVDHLGFNTPWPATGFIGATPLRWNQWGASVDLNLDHHITGPWVEPEPKPEARVIEGWVNVYDHGFGCVVHGTPCRAADAITDSTINAVHLATIRISHTVEEE